MGLTNASAIVAGGAGGFGSATVRSPQSHLAVSSQSHPYPSYLHLGFYRGGGNHEHDQPRSCPSSLMALQAR